MPRRSIDVEGFQHTNPIPSASRVGPLLASSVILPREPGGTHTPDSVDEQLANLFTHIGRMLEAGGADWRHIVKVSFYVPDLALRDAINGPWVQRFPDPASRPARHTQLTAAGGRAISCEFLAYIDD